MLLSKFFLPLIKNDPSEASIISHKLMLRSGMIRQSAAGIYSWLPMGVLVLQKISNIVRKNLNNAGAMEIIMPLMQPASLWKQSGRYKDGSDLATETLVASDRHDNELIFSPTAEELVSDIFKSNIQSYKDLPKNLYQIHWKFRDEIRPRYGALRCREFLMKDAYSFDLSEDDAISSYDRMLSAYARIYQEMGLQAIPVQADSGSMGGDHTHEFHVLANTGESTIFYDEKLLSIKNITSDKLRGLYAREEAKHDDAICKDTPLVKSKSIEVGHIFYLGQKYSKAMDVRIQNKEGKLIHPYMGCYGIGISRLIGAIIEANHDERGIIWPQNVAPFKCIIISMKGCDDIANNLYHHFADSNFEVLRDDTNDSPGSKFARADLIGIPAQIVISRKTNDIKSQYYYNFEIRLRKNSDIQTSVSSAYFTQSCDTISSSKNMQHSEEAKFKNPDHNINTHEYQKIFSEISQKLNKILQQAD